MAKARIKQAVNRRWKSDPDTSASHVISQRTVSPSPIVYSLSNTTTEQRVYPYTARRRSAPTRNLKKYVTSLRK